MVPPRPEPVIVVSRVSGWQPGLALRKRGVAAHGG